MSLRTSSNVVTHDEGGAGGGVGGGDGGGSGGGIAMYT